MKILEVNSVCGTGSTGRIACQIADIVVQHGGEARVAYGRSQYIKGCGVPIYRIGSDFDVKMHVGLSRITDRQGFYSKRVTKKFIEYIKAFNPDIIHLHNIHGYYLHLPTFFDFLVKFGKPVVWTLHDCWAFTGHCAYFDFVGCEKWKTGCYHCPQKKSYPKSFLLDQSKRNWKEKQQLFTSISNLTIVTPSYWLAGLVKASFLKDYKLKVINNGIDLSIFKPYIDTIRNEYNLHEKFIILGVASVWDRRKGLKYFEELARELESDEVIILIGLKKKQARNMPKNIICIPRTNNTRELAIFYNSADVYINPTLEDNFPTTNLEALACGTPVITFNTGGSPESIEENCGYIVKVRDISNLKNAIRDLRKNKFSEDFCLSRSKKFDNNEMYNSYFNLFKSIVDGSKI